MRSHLGLAVVTLTACAHYHEYVSDVFEEDGQLYLEKCPHGLGGLGCHTEAVERDPGATIAADDLDGTIGRAALDDNHSDVARCGTADDRAHVALVVTVAPGGHVERISVADAPDRELATCMVAAVLATRFPPTLRGGTFSYRAAI
jgi:hypothetical protein